MTHPNVCRVFDLGRHKTADGGEVVFITMELLRGETLSERLKANGKLTTRETLTIVRQIAAGMDAAHAAGVVHRDLKPGNVILVPDPATGGTRAIVTDFGVAHGTSDPFDDVSGTGDIVGSPAYMAPEQIEGAEVSPRTDVYALGIIMYEMVTGVRPFQGETSISAVVKRLKVDPPRPTVHAPELPAAWESTILRCLARDPAQRFASCSEVVDAITGGTTAPVQRLDAADVAGTDVAGTDVAGADAAGRHSSDATSSAVHTSVASAPAQPIAPAPRPSRTRMYALGAGLLALAGGAAALMATRSHDGGATRTQTGSSTPASPSGSSASASPAIRTGGVGDAGVKERVSLAVLPFKDTSPKKDQGWLSDGFSEELLVQLARIQDVRVVGRNSAAALKDSTDDEAVIAKKLGVTNLVQGSVAKLDDRIRITARLIRATDGTQLWADSFDRDGKDVFGTQSEIARAVAKALALELGEPSASTVRFTNPAAYEQVLRARSFARGDNKVVLGEGAAAYKLAIELDPGYADPYAGLAYVMTYLADYQDDASQRQKDIALAFEYARKAVKLGPEAAIAHRVLGYLEFTYEWNWEAARTSLERAIELEPRDGDTLRMAARLAEAVGNNQRANELGARALDVEPLLSPSWTELGNRQIAEGNIVEARKAIMRALELNPSSTFAKYRLCIVDLLEKKFDDALAHAATLETEAFRLMVTSMAQHSRGHAKEARAALDRFIATGSHAWAYQIAGVFAWQRDLDHAFEWLEKALAIRDGGLPELRDDPVMRNLHSDPRFNAFLAKIKLPPL